MLDIFGLENHKNNSFEQFCINFANEKLQQYCAENVYSKERNLYKSEGLEDFIDLSSNANSAYSESKEVVDLYSMKHVGLFYLLNDQAGVSMASRNISANRNAIESNNSDIVDNELLIGENLLEIFQQKHRNHPKFKVPRKKEEEPVFIITHYAGEIKYSTKKFISKNHDKPSKEIKMLIKQCQWNFMKHEVFGARKLGRYYWKLLRSVVLAGSAFRQEGKIYRARPQSQRSFKQGLEDNQDVLYHHNTSYSMCSDLSILHERHAWSDSKLSLKYFPDDKTRPSDESLKRAKLINYKMRYQANERKKLLKEVCDTGNYPYQYGDNSIRDLTYRKISENNRLEKLEITGCSSVHKTISQEYMSSIDELINELNKSSPYFIRCLRVGLGFQGYECPDSAGHAPEKFMSVSLNFFLLLDL